MNKCEIKAVYPYKVALLINFIPPYCLYLYRSLDARLDELRIFLSTPIEPNRPWPSEWGGLNVSVQRNLTLHRTWRHPHGFSEPLYIHMPYDTLLLLGRYQPDIVISAELGLRTLQAVLYRKWHPKSRLIVRATLSEYSEQGRGRLREWLRRWLLPQADAVLVNGESGARYIRLFGVPDKSVFRAPPYTIDISSFSSTCLQREPEYAHRLLYAGQLIERKGLLPFLLTLYRWAQDHPDRSLELWLVGDGPLRITLEQLTFPPSVSLRFLGNVPYAEMPKVYAQAGIFVFPTLADEWGMVVNEAMAAGAPVLGSVYSQAVEELITDGITGWAFHPDKANEVYTALNQALSTPIEVLDKMRAACQERIQDLAPEFIVDRILQAIHYVMVAQSCGNSGTSLNCREPST